MNNLMVEVSAAVESLRLLADVAGKPVSMGRPRKEGFLDRMKAHVSVGFFGRYQGKKSGKEMMATPKDVSDMAVLRFGKCRTETRQVE